MSVLLQLLGFDPGESDVKSSEVLKENIKDAIIVQRVKRSSMTNQVHLEFSNLVASKRLTAKQSAFLHMVWVMGR